MVKELRYNRYLERKYFYNEMQSMGSRIQYVIKLGRNISITLFTRNPSECLISTSHNAESFIN